MPDVFLFTYFGKFFMGKMFLFLQYFTLMVAGIVVMHRERILVMAHSHWVILSQRFKFSFLHVF